MTNQEPPIEQRLWETMVTELCDSLPKDKVVVRLDDQHSSGELDRVRRNFRTMYPSTLMGYSERVNYVGSFQEEGAALAFQKMALKAGFDATLHTHATYLEAYEPCGLQREVHGAIADAFGF